MQAYSEPSREDDPYALPDVEVFRLSNQDFIRADTGSVQAEMLANAMECGGDRFTEAAGLAGWYWWACFPGCLPDSDPHGPFATEAEALADAQEGGVA